MGAEAGLLFGGGELRSPTGAASHDFWRTIKRSDNLIVTTAQVIGLALRKRSILVGNLSQPDSRDAELMSESGYERAALRNQQEVFGTPASFPS